MFKLVARIIAILSTATLAFFLLPFLSPTYRWAFKKGWNDEVALQKEVTTDPDTLDVLNMLPKFKV